MHTETLDSYVEDISSRVARHAHAGTGPVTIRCSSTTLRRMIVERVLVHLGWKCIVMTPNTAVQARWLDRYGGSERIERAARMHWGEHTVHCVSPLPFSCAPVLVLSMQHTAARSTPENMEKDAERLARHLIKHTYRMLVIDGDEPVSGLWRLVLDKLAAHGMPFVIRLDAADPDAAAGNDPALPVFSIPAPVAVRAGFVAPYRHLAWIADARTGGSPDAAIRASVLEILHAEQDALHDHLRALVIAPHADTDAADQSAETAQSAADLLHEAMLGDARIGALHPVLATGSTFVCDDDRVIPILSEVQTCLRQHTWDVRVTHVQLGSRSELYGTGADWNARTYALIASWLLLRGATHCILAPPSLLSMGWEECPVSCVIDITAGTSALTFHQTDESRALDPEVYRGIVDMWDVLPLTDEGASTPELAARLERLRTRFSPAPDGMLEAGFTDVRSFCTAPDLHEGGVSHFNETMLARIGRREQAALAWRTSAAVVGRAIPSAIITRGERERLTHVPMQNVVRSLERDIAWYRERTQTQRLRYTIWGVVASGIVMSSFLLMPEIHGAIVAGLCVVAWVSFVVSHWVSVRRMRPRSSVVPSGDILVRLAASVESALQSGDLLPRQAGSRLATAETDTGTIRVWLDQAPTHEALLFSESLLGCVREPHPDEPYVHLFTLDPGDRPLRTLARDESLDACRAPAVTVAFPPSISANPALASLFVQALRDQFGAAERVESASDDPQVSHSAAPVWIYV